MNYPAGTIVQNYNVSSGRLIQLPCWMDQPEPPDGFRAVVLGSFDSTDANINQNGPPFDPSLPAAVQFDLTTIVGSGNLLSRARSVAVSCSSSDVGSTDQGAPPFLTFDSGWNYAGTLNNGVANAIQNTTIVGDFLSAVPIFGVFFYPSWSAFGPGCVVVANFKLDFNSFYGGLSASAG